jgi:hypothetical protein
MNDAIVADGDVVAHYHGIVDMTVVADANIHAIFSLWHAPR